MVKRILLFALFFLLALPVLATETENLGIRILPAPGKVVVDGKVNDWDLTGGIFACGDVENLRGNIACWFHVMYDANNLYILARWVDDTPLNNPGSIAGDAGFAGDCLQTRIITAPGTALERASHITAWRDRNALDVIDMVWGKSFNEGSIKDAKTKGAQQAFLKNADNSGYTQEMALPWALIAKEGFAPKAGQRMVITVEPNFSTDTKFRISLKDLFRPGVIPDRVFTFRAYTCWGFGAFEAKGNVVPQPLRLTDNREFTVRMEKGLPVIDWTGLYESKKMEGFVTIPLTMPEDGYVSLNILNANGQVVRQLLNCTFLTKGKHKILWDGLTNLSHQQPGEVVPAGAYTWKAIRHQGIGLRLVGWAHNGGRAPFDSPGGNWGGDQGSPCTVTSDGKAIYLGWSGSEAGKAVVATDLDGGVKWRHKRGGFGNAQLLATTAGVVYVYDRQQGDNVIYRLDAAKGEYTPWQGSDDATLNVSGLLQAAIPAGNTASQLTGMDAAAGKLFLSCAAGNVVAVVDGATGKLLATIPVAGAGDLEVGADGKLYVIAAKSTVLRINLADNKAETAVTGLQNATSLALDATGAIYVGVGDPDNQVKVFSAAGKPLRTIGKSGGRALLGPWEQNGMRFIHGLRVDTNGKLWVAEDDDKPRRVSVWDATTGDFRTEFFGPTDYGAVGGAISPLDPYTMVGHGCEWKLDPATGKASCLGVFHRGGMSNARFGVGANGRQYVAVGGDWHNMGPVMIYERLSAGQWKRRTSFTPINEKNKLTGVRVWADENDDALEQENETHSYNIALDGWMTGWYMPMAQSLTFYGGLYRIAVTGYTACGAPMYDLSLAKKMPAPADLAQRGGMGAQRDFGNADGTLVLYNGRYGAAHSDFQCFDIERGTLKWTYPNTYVGVHGGHLAPPKEVGLIRGAYDIVGTAKLPAPIGDIFVIPTDKGEWHILTGEGFYLTSLFESDPMKIKWPSPAAPGAIMDTVPPGMGAEDFGGSIICTQDGALYIQAGKTAFINMKVVGLDSVKKLGQGKLTIKKNDLTKAGSIREKLLQQTVGTRQATVKKRTVPFTGDIRKDFAFAPADLLHAEKSPTAAIDGTVAYDDANLYLGWQVNDDTPWVNGATEPAVMYCSGDTVDFQLGTNPLADKKRGEAVLGDLRLSIGNFQGKPTAVVYRRIATDKHPRKFYSGVVRDGYLMESVTVLNEAKITVKVDAARKTYVVEAAIPLSALGLTAAPGVKLSGDLGATHGDAAGADTVLRSYWNNQSTGLVADEVFELKMEPANWGLLLFE